jgi:DNA polymerase IV
VAAQDPQTPSASSESFTSNHPEPFDKTLKEGLAQDPLSNYNDDLTNIIDEVRPFQHVPLDLEDDGDSRPNTPQDADPISQTDDDLGTLHPSNKPKRSWQDTFQCMEKHDGTSTDSNPNASTVAILQQMANFYDRTHDQWRTVAYRKAITSLNKQTKRIVYKEEAIKLPFVGERLATKIEEIAITARLRRLDNAKRDPRDQILQSFMDIYGVGIAQASRWVNAGFSTLDDLMKGAKLTEAQKIGIAHYENFRTRVSRSEVEQHGTFVRKALEKIDKDFEVTIMGSYRRGAESSGDIDLMITKPGADMHYIRSTIIDQLVPQLLVQGFFKATLAQTSKDTGTKWHGCSCLPSSTT